MERMRRNGRRGKATCAEKPVQERSIRQATGVLWEISGPAVPLVRAGEKCSAALSTEASVVLIVVSSGLTLDALSRTSSRCRGCLRGEGCPAAPQPAQSSRCSAQRYCLNKQCRPSEPFFSGNAGTLLKSICPDPGQGIFTAHAYSYFRTSPSWVGPACPVVSGVPWLQPVETAPIHPKVHLRKPRCPFEFQALNVAEPH